MLESDRRKFLRVLFEANFEVRASDWIDNEATGLDISLNGCRFNCKQSMSDGEVISIIFKPGLELEGIVRWCWPIEWYFQAALFFKDIVQENQDKLKAYIEEVTGENYQMQKDEENLRENTVESIENFEEDLDQINENLRVSITELEDQEELPKNSNEDFGLEELPSLEEDNLLNIDIAEPIDNGSGFLEVVEDQEELSENSNGDAGLEELPPLEEADLLNLDIEDTTENFSKNSDTNEVDEGDISTLSLAGQQVVLFDLVEDQASLLIQYLSERAAMKVEYVTKKENLWRLLKIDPTDLVILETGAHDNLESIDVLKQTKDQFPEVHFICISGPVSLERRLQFLNAGALDYLTRPLHLSTIAQSVLVHLSHTMDLDFAEETTNQGEMMAANKVLQEELDSMKEQRDEAIADAKVIAAERDEAKVETKELEQRAKHLADEKESIYLNEVFEQDAESITDSSQIGAVEQSNGTVSLLEEDLTISGEIDLIEEDY
tara:strand:+ start:4299 stop:5777 length:1479 start_codon:yes stop_codon:yes gene_type:complete